jgi:NitT/TauT family transport system ATP-binding protein
MRMRVSIARALVTQPEVMLLDEPFAALDELTRQRLQEDLLQLAAAQGWSMLFVTHSAVEAIYLADRVAVLSPRPGRLQELIPIDLPRPRSPALLGAPAFAAALSHLSQALRRGAETGGRP